MKGRSRPDDRSPFAPSVLRALQPPGDPIGDSGVGAPKRPEAAEVRGKSELHRAVSRVTPGQGNLTDQWHRKDTARFRP
jgi:hypothetical protein